MFRRSCATGRCTEFCILAAKIFGNFVQVYSGELFFSGLRRRWLKRFCEWEIDTLKGGCASNEVSMPEFERAV